MSNPGDYEHLVRILGVIGWQRVTPPDPDGSVIRFASDDGDPDHWVDLPMSMEPLQMAETLTRAAFQIATGAVA